MKDTLGTIFGFVLGLALLLFGIIFPDEYSNYYVYQVTKFDTIITKMELDRRPRVEIERERQKMKEFKDSIPASLSRFIDAKSFGIVVGGMFAASLIAFPFSQVMRFSSFIFGALKSDTLQEDFLEVYETVLRLGEKRVQGEILSDKDVEGINNTHLKNWVQDFVTVDVVSEDMIGEIVQSEIEMYNYRIFQEIDLLKFMGSVAPAFGMVGTVVGLILMLGAAAGEGTRISDVMGAMSVALITTLYGVLFAQLIFLPVATKRYQLKESYNKLMEMIQESIIYLRRKENVEAIGQDLIIYLPEQLRERIARERMEAMEAGDLGL